MEITIQTADLFMTNVFPLANQKIGMKNSVALHSMLKAIHDALIASGYIELKSVIQKLIDKGEAIPEGVQEKAVQKMEEKITFEIPMTTNEFGLSVSPKLEVNYELNACMTALAYGSITEIFGESIFLIIDDKLLSQQNFSQMANEIVSKFSSFFDSLKKLSSWNGLPN